MNFKIIEGAYVNFEDIKEKFTEDYMYSNIKNPDLKRKYKLTKREWKEFTDKIKKEHGLTSRPRRLKQKKHYYKQKNKYRIMKSINSKTYFLGSVTSEELAKVIVEKCKEAEWDIDECKKIVEKYTNHNSQKRL